jgi:ferritin
MREDVERLEDVFEPNEVEEQEEQEESGDEEGLLDEFEEVSPLLSSLSEWYNKELYSAYLYRFFSAKANAVGLLGIEQFFYRKWEEETEHAEEVLQFTLKRCKDAEFLPIDGDFDSLLGSGNDLSGLIINMFTATVKHEKEVTTFIRELKEQLGDVSCEAIINKYLDEQVEEEDEVTTLLDRATLASDEGSILSFDQEMYSGLGDTE